MNASTQMAPDSGSSPLERYRVLLEQSVKEVFSMMVGVEVIAPQADPPVFADVTAMVGLAGELCGIMSVRCNKNAATQIASRMLGVSLADAYGHQSDSLGEICNMVAGNFKAKIQGLQDRCMLSVPTVITGEDYQLHSLAVGDRLELAFMFETEPIWVGLELRG